MSWPLSLNGFVPFEMGQDRVMMGRIIELPMRGSLSSETGEMIKFVLCSVHLKVEVLGRVQRAFLSIQPQVH